MKFSHDAAHLMGQLHSLEARTQAAENRILLAAQQRETTVRKRMEDLRPKVFLERGAAREYQLLALERRRLALVIGMAQAHITQGSVQPGEIQTPGMNEA